MNLEHENIRLESTALGNFASDLVIDAYLNAEVVIMNSGSFKNSTFRGYYYFG